MIQSEVIKLQFWGRTERDLTVGPYHINGVDEGDGNDRSRPGQPHALEDLAKTCRVERLLEQVLQEEYEDMVLAQATFAWRWLRWRRHGWLRNVKLLQRWVIQDIIL